MMRIDPIIGVKDVKTSSEWYQSVFKCRNAHGGDEFAVLVSENNEIFMCLHKWGEHQHPSIFSPDITPGNGLILYFRTENMNQIRENVEKLGYPVEDDIRKNPNSRKMEFSLRDPDGYYLTISEFHRFEG